MRTSLTKANPSAPVTRYAHQDFTQVSLSHTVGEALDALRRQPPKGRIIYFYVVDTEGRLQGVVPTRRLILSPPDTPLAEIMVRQVVALSAEATVLEACEFFIQHRLLAFPVVDAERRLIGVVDMELYTDELSNLGDAKSRDDLFQLLGIHVARAQQDSPLLAFRNRFPWLGCNLVAGILAALLCGIYQGELNRVVALAFFIPVVLNLAESVSSQSVSLTLQILHGLAPTRRSMLRKLWSELLTGLLLGLGSGAVVGIVAFLWLGQVRVLFCLLGGITGGVVGEPCWDSACRFCCDCYTWNPALPPGRLPWPGRTR
jgi:magnesium transporter